MPVLTHPNKLQRLVSTIQKLYPISHADSTWDNTGLLVDSSSLDATTTTGTNKLNILLTIDLTQSVVEEAMKLNSNLILAYHPFIFRGLKSVNQTNPQQKSLIKLIQNGISVYCPHTSIDASIDGVNDWLIDGITSNGANLGSKEIIEPNKVNPSVGMGRIITLKEPISLKESIQSIKKHLNLKHLQLASGETELHKKFISKIAICAGSGGSLFKNIEADLFYTGELSHHEALFLKESGSNVIICNHSNTERGFLKVLKEQLLNEFNKDEESEEVGIDISATDCDPFVVV